MKLYVTTRMVEEFDLEENQILDLLKKAFPIAEDIQFAKKLDDIEDVNDAIMEMADFLTESDVDRKIKDSSIFGTLDYNEAYEVMEWGIH